MATNVSQVLTALGQNLAEDAMSMVNPAISSVIGDMIGNPKDWNDPATAVIKGAAAVATIVAGISNPLEAAAIAGAAQLVSSLWQVLKPHVDVKNLAIAAATPVVSGPAGTQIQSALVTGVPALSQNQQPQPAAVPSAPIPVDPSINGLADASHM